MIRISLWKPFFNFEKHQIHPVYSICSEKTQKANEYYLQKKEKRKIRIKILKINLRKIKYASNLSYKFTCCLVLNRLHKINEKTCILGITKYNKNQTN